MFDPPQGQLISIVRESSKIDRDMSQSDQFHIKSTHVALIKEI